MKHLISRFIIVTMMVVASPVAFAQSNILVVDTNKVINDSQVGQHIKRQVEQIGTTMDSELKSKTQPFATKGKSLQTDLQGQTMEALQSRPDLQRRIVELRTEEQELAREAQIMQLELQATEAKALNPVRAKLVEIIEAVAKERGADVVLEKRLVLYGAPADVTSTVLSRLNSQMTTVPVSRERIPRQAAQSGTGN